MEKCRKFKKLSLSNLNSIHGGLEDLPTEMRNDDGELLYTDVHADNDNNGVWSCGDTYTITKV